eukprot:7757635-Pyramimonas_sp.AAC.1
MGPDFAVPPPVPEPASARIRVSALLRTDQGRGSPNEEEELEGTRSAAMRGFAAGEASYAAFGECPPSSESVPASAPVASLGRSWGDRG